MAVDSTTRELIADCLARIESGDTCAPLDLASLFMSHAKAWPMPVERQIPNSGAGFKRRVEVTKTLRHGRKGTL